MQNQTIKTLLNNFKIISLANNLPGPVAVSRLQSLGAAVVKIEPPAGDPLSRYSPAWYRQLTQGQQVVRLDLKTGTGRQKLDERLKDSDLLITSMRLTALERLKLNRSEVSKNFSHLLQIAIVGYASDSEKLPGHDLTYQAALRLLSPPQMPKTLLTDLAAAERIVSAALELILARKKELSTNYA